jgi:PAS domain S-box-containing protein
MRQRSRDRTPATLQAQSIAASASTPANSTFILPRPILLVLAALGFLFAIDLFALGAYRELRQASNELEGHIHAAEVLQALPRMMLDIESGMRGYLLTGSIASLNRYRAAAEQMPVAAEKALAVVSEDSGQRKLIEAGAAAALEWVTRYASPLVVKRSAGGEDPSSIAAIVKIMRASPGDIQAARIRAQFEQAVQMEREHMSAAQGTLTRKFDRISTWMKGRALALLLALAALTLMLGRMLAKLTGQMRSREAAESAMRTSSATMRAMSDASPLGMFLADGSGACVQSNASFERITGLAGAGVLGDGWQSALHPDDQGRVVAAWYAATASGASFASVHRFVHPNGKVVWASMKSARMTDGGRPMGFACSIEDVSERREAEDALRKSEERLHLALESSHLALFDWHIPSGEIFLSREWNVLTGYGSQPLTTTVRRVNEMISPEDMEALNEAIVGTFKTNRPMSRIALRIETKAGHWKRVYCSGRVSERDGAGRAVRLTGTIAAD